MKREFCMHERGFFILLMRHAVALSGWVQLRTFRKAVQPTKYNVNNLKTPCELCKVLQTHLCNVGLALAPACAAAVYYYKLSPLYPSCQGILINGTQL